MRDGRKHRMTISVGGVLGGLVGTAALQKAMGLSQKLPEPLHMPEMVRDPGDFVISRVEELAGGPLARRTHERAARAAHWIYGLAWAAALAAFARPLKMHRPANAAIAGATMGAITWATAFFGWLPRAGLTKPVSRERASKMAAALLGHIAYGVLAAAPICAAEMLWARRGRSFRSRLLSIGAR
jgi:hypothetical protein